MPIKRIFSSGISRAPLSCQSFGPRVLNRHISAGWERARSEIEMDVYGPLCLLIVCSDGIVSPARVGKIRVLRGFSGISFENIKSQSSHPNNRELSSTSTQSTRLETRQAVKHRQENWGPGSVVPPAFLKETLNIFLPLHTVDFNSNNFTKIKFTFNPRGVP